MNTKDGVINGVVSAESYVETRIKNKAGLNINSSELKCLGVQEFSERGFLNLVYFYSLSNEEVEKLKSKGALSQITDKTIDDDKNQDSPGGAALTLALEYLEKNKE